MRSEWCIKYWYPGSPVWAFWHDYFKKYKKKEEERLKKELEEMKWLDKLLGIQVGCGSWRKDIKNCMSQQKPKVSK